jgi:hypothetical protein
MHLLAGWLSKDSLIFTQQKETLTKTIISFFYPSTLQSALTKLSYMTYDLSPILPCSLYSRPLPCLLVLGLSFLSYILSLASWLLLSDEDPFIKSELVLTYYICSHYHMKQPPQVACADCKATTCQRWASTLANRSNARHRSNTWPSIERSERLYFFEKLKAKTVPSTTIVVDPDVGGTFILSMLKYIVPSTPTFPKV